MANRIGKIERKTTETSITMELNLDGVGKYDIDTGAGFAHADNIELLADLAVAQIR